MKHQHPPFKKNKQTKKTDYGLYIYSTQWTWKTEIDGPLKGDSSPKVKLAHY